MRLRYLTKQIRQDLESKMVFVAGPRQVGKTTLALSLPGAEPGYLNWDVAEDREHILRREYPANELWVFDEIHKYSRWRDLLKGLWDSKPRRASDGKRILVTGSARLDYYRYSGDSLQGRYVLLRLHPFSLAELGGGADTLAGLLRFGGFPEPFSSGSERSARRWSRQYRQLLIREEITSLERVRDLGQLEALLLRLPDLVGSLLSVNSLREDLRVSHATVESWLAILERLYAIFRIAPIAGPRIRALRKAQKHYHFDWTLVTDEPARFENLVACHLLKWVQFEIDRAGRDLDLRYFRDTDGREVDFVITEADRPIVLVECKWRDGALDKNLRYLHTKYPESAAWQISATGAKDAVTPEGVRLAPATTFLAELV